MKKTIRSFFTAAISLATLLITGSALAVDALVPVAVWSGDFRSDKLSKIGTDNQTYTLSVNQNTVAEDGSYVLMKEGTNGIYVDWTTGIGAATVIFRCENVPTEIVAGKNSCYATVYNTSSNNRVGAVRRSSDGKMQGIWNNSLWSASPTADFPTSTGKQVYALAYQYNAGTLFRCNVDGGWTTLLNASNLGSPAYDNNTIKGFSVLGYRGTSSDMIALEDAKVTGIAVFKTKLSADEIAAYEFPEAPFAWSAVNDGAEFTNKSVNLADFGGDLGDKQQRGFAFQTFFKGNKTDSYTTSSAQLFKTAGTANTITLGTESDGKLYLEVVATGKTPATKRVTTESPVITKAGVHTFVVLVRRGLAGESQTRCVRVFMDGSAILEQVQKDSDADGKFADDTLTTAEFGDSTKADNYFTAYITDIKKAVAGVLDDGNTMKTLLSGASVFYPTTWGTIGSAFGGVAWRQDGAFGKSPYTVRFTANDNIINTGIGNEGKVKITSIKLMKREAGNNVPASITLTQGSKSITSSAKSDGTDLTIYGNDRTGLATRGYSQYTFDSEETFDPTQDITVALNTANGHSVMMAPNSVMGNGTWSPVIEFAAVYTYEPVTAATATLDSGAEVFWIGDGDLGIKWNGGVAPSATIPAEITVNNGATIYMDGEVTAKNITFKGTGTVTIIDNDYGTSPTYNVGKITSEIPIIVASETMLTVDSGNNDLIYNYSGEAAPTTVPPITCGGNLTLGGYSEIKWTAGVAANKTLTINDGCKVYYYGSGQSIQGTININKNATLVNKNDNDTLGYGSSAHVNVWGTLDMSNTRWTIGNNNVITLYAGAKSIGEGHATYKAFDFNTANNILKFALGDAASGTATLTTGLRMRNGTGPTLNIPENMTVEFGSIFSTEYDNRTVTKSGAGALKILDALRMGKNTYTLNVGEGMLDLSAITGGSLATQIPGNVTIGSGVAIRFPTGWEEDAPFTLCGSTLSAPETVNNAVVYVGEELKSGAVLTYDATNRTVSYMVPTVKPIDLSNKDTVTIQDIIDEVNDSDWTSEVDLTLKAGATLKIDDTTIPYLSIKTISAGGVTLDVTNAANLAKFDFAAITGDITITTATALDFDAGSHNLIYNYTGTEEAPATISTTGIVTFGGTGVIKPSTSVVLSPTKVVINEGATVKYVLSGSKPANLASLTFDGEGTLIINGSNQGNPEGKITNFASSWTGLTWIQDFQGGNERTPWYHGTVNSTIRYTHVQGWLRANRHDQTATGISFEPTVELVDNNQGVALDINNGNGGWNDSRAVEFAALVGDGTMNYGWAGQGVGGYALVIRDISKFEGSLTSANAKSIGIAIGASATWESTGQSKIVLLSDATATIPNGKSWAAVNGIVVNGTIGGAGILGNDTTFGAGATLDCTKGTLSLDSGKTATFGSTLNITGVTAPTGDEVVKVLNGNFATTKFFGCRVTIGGSGTYILEQQTDGIYVSVATEGDTYTFSAEEQAAISQIELGGVYSTAVKQFGITKLENVPAGYFAWVEDGVNIYAAKKSDSISLKTGTRTIKDNDNQPWATSILSTDANVGGFPVAGKFWNNTKISNGNQAEVKDYMLLTDGNGNLTEVAVAYRAHNTYYAKYSGAMESGNMRLTGSYLDDNQESKDTQYTISESSQPGVTIPGGSVTLPKAPNARGWQFEVSNIPYEMYDLYVYIASDVQDNVDNANSHLYACPVVISCDGENWTYYAGPSKATDNDSWEAYGWAHANNVVEGKNYIRFRISKNSTGLDDISTIHITHGTRNTNTNKRLGLAGIQIVEIDDDGVRDRVVSTEETQSWHDENAWSKKKGEGTELVNWTDSDETTPITARIDADTIPEIVMDSAAVTDKLVISNTAPETDAPEKTFTISGSAALTVISSIDATAFHGRLVFTAPINGSISLGQNAYIEVNIPANETKTVEDLIPGDLTVVGNSIKLTGSGTLLCEDELPPNDISLQETGWTGTLYLKNLTWENWGFGAKGTANTKVKVTGVKGFGPNSTGDGANPELILEDANDVKALLVTNGYGGKDYFFRKVTGSGTFGWDPAVTEGPQNGHTYIFKDVSGFTGVFDAGTYLKIVVGETTAGAEKGSITFANGTTIKPNNWTAKKAYFGATLNLASAAVDDVIVSGLDTDPGTLPAITVGGQPTTLVLKYENGAVKVVQAAVIEITGEASISAINTQAGSTPAIVTIKGENAAVKFDAEPAVGIKFVAGEGATVLKFVPGNGAKFVSLAETKQFIYEGFTSFKYEWAAGEVISLNFGSNETNASMSGEGKTDTFAGVQIPDASWINLTGGNSTDVAVDKFYDSDADATFDISGMTVSYNGGNNGTWKPATQSNYPFMNGYLDDNDANSPTVTIKNVPFSTYDVIVYMQGDNGSRTFTPIQINDNLMYTYDSTGAIVSGTDFTAENVWGLENQTDISYEHNVIRITDLSGETKIKPLVCTNTGLRRGTLAAIQIVNTGTPLVTKWIRQDYGVASAWDNADNWNNGVPTANTIAVIPAESWSAVLTVTDASVAKLLDVMAMEVSINGSGAQFGGLVCDYGLTINGGVDPIVIAGTIAGESSFGVAQVSIDSGVVKFDAATCNVNVFIKGNATLAGSGTIHAVTVEKNAILKPNADGFVITGAWAQNSGAEIKPIKIDCSLITADDVESAITLISLGSDCTGVINDVIFEGGATGLVFVKSADNKSIIASKTCIWTGAGADHNWSNTANWQGGVVPMAGIPVIINLGTDVGEYTINLPDSAVEVGSLTLSGSATSFAFAGTGSLSATSYDISGLTATTIDLSKTTFNAAYTIPANSTLVVNGAAWTSEATFAADTSKIRYAGTYTAIGGTFAGASENVKGTVEFGGTYNAAAGTRFTDASVKYSIVGTVNVESGNFGFGTVEFSLEPGCAVTVAGNFLCGEGNGSKGYFNGGTLTANKIVIGTTGTGANASEDYYFGDGSSANNTMVITANEIYNNYGGQSTGMHVHVRNGCTINVSNRIWSDATVNPQTRQWFLEGGKFVFTGNCSVVFQQLRSVTGTTEFEVADSKTLTLTVEAHGSLTKTGVIRKTGTGTIVFANNPAASFTIAAGTAIVDAGNEGTVSVDGEGSGVLKVKVAYAQWISGYNSTATIPEGKNIVFVLPDSTEITGERNVLPPKAADRKWVGTTDNNWNVADNWTPSGVPGETDSVEIDSTDKEIAITLPNGGVTVGGITFKGGNAIALTGDAINVGVVVKVDAGSAEVVGGTIATSIQVVGGTLAISGDYTLPAEIATESGATLELDVASAKTITSVISGAGAFKKTGAGTLTMNGLSSYTGGTTVEAGGIVFGVTSSKNVGPIGAYYTNSTTDWDYNKAVVKNGAFIDVNGKQDMCYTFDLEAGALLKNAGSTIGDTSRQTRRVALLGNATVNAVSNAFGIHNGSHYATQLVLGEYTLTKIGNGAFELVNTVISGTGTIDVQAGTLWFNTTGSAMNDGTIKLGADGALRVSANATVKNFIANNTAITGNGTLIVTGLLDLSAVENNTLQAVNLTLTEGMTFKFPAGYMGESKFTLCSGTLTPASGTLNANIDFGNKIEQVQLVIADKGITFEFPNTTWTGGESGEETDWDVATNWTHGVPKATTAVTIPADANISLTSASIASSITLEGSATLTMDGVTAANIKSIAVPTGATLTINVEEGNTATVGLISGEGAVAKSGAGTLTLSAANTFAGGVVINGGVVTRGAANAFGAANTVVEVKSGASLNWGDTALVGNAYRIKIAGTGAGEGKSAFYTSTNNSTLGSGSQRHPISLELTDDATIGGAYNFGIMYQNGKSYNVATVTLNDHTLTKVGSGIFYTSNIEFSNGTVVVDEGTLSVINNMDNDTFHSNAKLVVGENGHLQAFRNLFTVYDVEFKAAANAVTKSDNNHKFIVKGTATGSFSAEKLEIAAGATIKLAQGESVSASNTLTLPTEGTITLDVTGYNTVGDYTVITAPNNYTWVTTKVTLVGNEGWEMYVDDNELKVKLLTLDADISTSEGYNYTGVSIDVDVTRIAEGEEAYIRVVVKDTDGKPLAAIDPVEITGKGLYQVPVEGLTTGADYTYEVTIVDETGAIIEGSKSDDGTVTLGDVQKSNLFSASAETGASDVDGGSWTENEPTIPTIESESEEEEEEVEATKATYYQIADDVTSVFTVDTVEFGDLVSIDFEIAFDEGFTTEIDQAEDTPPQAGVTISAEAESATKYWYVCDNGAWKATTTEAIPGAYTVTMEFDYPNKKVRYSINGTPLTDSSAKVWFANGVQDATEIATVAFTGDSRLTKFGANAVTIDTNLAESDNTKYATVEDVVGAINAGTSITLLTNVSVDSAALDAGEYTIDLDNNKFKWSADVSKFITFKDGKFVVKEITEDDKPKNGVDSYTSYVFNLDAEDPADKPFIKQTGDVKADKLTFKCYHGTGGAAIVPRDGAKATYQIEVATDPAFGTGTMVETSPKAKVDQPIDVELPSDTSKGRVLYYRAKLNAE